MRDTVRPISDKMLRELTSRAHRLTTTIESATRSASDVAVRREGARFGEVIEEWLDDIKGLIESQDATAADRVESFETRLRMAERKVDDWKLPPMPSTSAPRRRTAKHTPPPAMDADIEPTSPWYADDMEEIPIASSADTPARAKGKKNQAA